VAEGLLVLLTILSSILMNKHILGRAFSLFAFAFALALVPLAKTQAAGEYLILARYDASYNDTFDVRGYNFPANTSVSVSFEGVTKTVTSDNGGNFVTSAFTVPFRLPGMYPVTAIGGGVTATGYQFINGFYPWGEASSYYVLPNAPLGFKGRHFAPYEPVKLFDGNNNLITTFTADGGGNFDTVSTIPTIPWDWYSSNRTYHMEGQMTGAKSSLEVVIGHFWPNITPKSYYVPFNYTMEVKGENFAPNEQVDLYLNGTLVQSKTADGGGNLMFTITSPSSGMEFELKAKGNLSFIESVRHVTLAQPGWAL
jgi:hypothetical protein